MVMIAAVAGIFNFVVCAILIKVHKSVKVLSSPQPFAIASCRLSLRVYRLNTESQPSFTCSSPLWFTVASV